MPHPLEQVAKALQDQWPRALSALGGLSITVGQLAWKTWQGRQTTNRMAALRAQISELSTFLETPLGESPSAAAIRQNTQEQYNRALNELADLCRPPQSRAVDKPTGPGRGILRRVFLLYTPTTFKGWVAHSLFYVSLLAMMFGTFGAALDNQDSDAVATAIAVMVVYGVTTYLLWRWATRISNAAAKGHKAPRSAWAPLTLIWIAAITGYSSVIGLSLDDEGDFSSAVFRANIWYILLVTAACATVIVLCARWRKRINKDRPPGPRWTWVPVALIVIAAVVESAVIGGFIDAQVSVTKATAPVFLVPMAACTVVIVLSIFWRRRMKKQFESKMKLEPAPEIKSGERVEAKKAAAS